MNKLTGLKDVDREVLKHLDDEDLLKVCVIDKRFWNHVCDENFFKRRLEHKYSGVQKYKKEKETWRNFYLRLMYYISKMKEEFKFIYKGGNFKIQYDLLKRYQKRKEDMLLNIEVLEDLSLTKYAVEHGADIHILGDYPLVNAIKFGNVEVVKYLIENGAYIEHPLLLASAKGYIDIVKYLVERGENINDKDWHNQTALSLANENGHRNVAEYLISKGAKN